MSQARHAVSKTLALLHRPSNGPSSRRDRAGAKTVRSILRRWDRRCPNPLCGRSFAADTPVLAAIFVASIEELTGDDYSEAQQQAWASAADDEEQFGKRLAAELTLIATLQNSPVGFASLKGADHIDMLYVHPGAVGQGVASMLCDALEKLAGGRGAKSLTVDASDNAQEFFLKARLRRQAAQHRDRQRRMACQHHDAEDAGRGSVAGSSDMSRERLYLFDTTLRDGAQTNGVDFTLHDKQLIARMLDELGIDYVEGGYPGANPTDTEFFANKAESRSRQLHGVRHDAASRPLGLERSGAGGAAGSQGGCDLLCREIIGLSGARRAGDHQRGKSGLDPRQREGRESRRAAKSCSTASISSTATRKTPSSRWPAPRRPMIPARAGWCCATPMAAPCRTRSRPSSPRW